MLQCCLNGARPAGGHPHVPSRPEELARDSQALAALGVISQHVHPRDIDGHETIDPGAVGAAVGAIHRAGPRTEVAVPIARWIEPNPLIRTHVVQRWAQLPTPERPDTAAVNVHDAGWRAVCAAAESVGIGIELGIWTAADAVTLRRIGLPPGTRRIVAEVTVDDPDTAIAEGARLLQALGSTGATPVLLHGEERAAWPVLEYALRNDLDTRIGLEDTLTGPHPAIRVDTNADLVDHALRYDTGLRRPTAAHTMPTGPGRRSQPRRPRHRR